MSRKIGILLFAFFCYLLWLYFAIYESSIDDWWTVNEIKQETGDTVQIGIINKGVCGYDNFHS